MIDADIVARQAVERTAGLTALVNRFGEPILNADGMLDRTGRKMFSDDAIRKE